LKPQSFRSRRPATSSLIWGAALVAACFWVLLDATSYYRYLGSSAVIAAILIFSVGVVAGDAGMATLCQVAFAAVSARTIALLSDAGHPLPMALEILIAIAAAAVAGLIVGLPALRLRSVNLAVMTLGVGVAVDAYLQAQATQNATIVARPAFATSERSFFILTLAVFGVVALLVGWLRTLPTGASWQSVKNSDRATASMGYSVTWAKLSAFAVGAAIAGVAGVLTIMQIGAADQTTFPATGSLIIFAAAIFIGGWRWQGALFAGTASVALPQLFTSHHISAEWSNLLFGVGAAQALAGGVAIADVFWKRKRPRLHDRSSSDEAWSKAVRTATKTASAFGREQVLTIRNMSVSYGGVVALDTVSVDVCRGEIVGLIGANGAGKTTLVDAVTGYTSYKGSVTLVGVEQTGTPQARAKAGLRRTFQQDRVVKTLTVEQYIQLSAHRKVSTAEIDQLIAFASVPAPDALVDRLEGSSRRLLEVAAALAARPDVVLLDEPVAGLSGAEALEFGQRLVGAPSVFGCALIVIEHDVEFVLEVCSRVFALDLGRVVATGKPTAVLADPKVRAAYLGELEEV
jgi:branched-chain amino acid transport system permease protein